MDETCKVQYMRKGRANSKLMHKGYKVERVFRVEMPERWSAYALMRRSTSILALQQGRRHATTKVSTWREWMRTKLQQDESSNEIFLFHGTKPDLVDIIAEA
eukprot:500655-Hanusia_phi.AAC.1